MSGLTAMAGGARAMARRLARLYYPNIDVTHRERIPATGPVLLTANHANSLMDPIIVGLAAQRPIHFMAKAPLFEVPVFGALMRALGMVPAYRGRDDGSQIGRNVQSIEAACSFLGRGDAVGIFPEGKSHDLPKVEQVRTGAARIALQTAQLGVNDLKIVPLGINYERKERFRSAVWVCVGEPIDVRSWLKEHPDEERRVMRGLTLEIDRRLKELVVHLQEESWEPFLNDLEILRPAAGAGKPARRPLKAYGGAGPDLIAAVRQRKRIADAMNYFLETDRPRAEGVAARIQRFREQLCTSCLGLQSPVLWLRGAPLWRSMIREWLWAVLGAIPALVGALYHLMPFAVTRLIAAVVQAPGRSTTAFARLWLGLPIYGAWYVFAAWRIAKVFGITLACIWTALMPLAGLFAFYYIWHARSMGAAQWGQLRMLWRKEELRTLRQEGEEIQRSLGQLAAEYDSRPATLATRPAEEVD